MTDSHLQIHVRRRDVKVFAKAMKEFYAGVGKFGVSDQYTSAQYIAVDHADAGWYRVLHRMAVRGCVFIGYHLGGEDYDGHAFVAEGKRFVRLVTSSLDELLIRVRYVDGRAVPNQDDLLTADIYFNTLHTAEKLMEPKGE